MRRVGHWVLLALLSAWVLAGCANKNRPAPVEDRSPNATTKTPAKMIAGAENAGKPGYYSIKSGDTLIRIGLDAGQNWRDLARWNKIDNPNLLEVGQVLRVVSPDQTPLPEAVVIKPVTAPTVVNSAGPDNKLATAPPTPPLPSTGVASATPATLADSEGLAFIWPHNGAIMAGFDESKNKGLAVAGKAGDPVLAAADGKVVYAGAGLRGYGNLVIIKHNNTFLSAYAHNQALLVREDQAVKRGQTIAQMGNSDADQVKLHFEIRRLGKPVDPVKFLPPR